MEMNYESFQALIDGYIERSSQESGEMPASVFFELLFKRAAQQVTETIEVEGHLVGDQLVLHLPVEKETTVQVQGNEILVGDRRIVVRLKPGTIHPVAI
jgi:hypothetical protein